MSADTNVLLAWTPDPLVLLGLGLAAGLYAVGWGRLRRRAHGRRLLAPWRPWAYAAGLLVVAVALLSPIGTFDDLLFWVHMLQHLLLILAAAPLLLLGAPLLPVLWGLPARERRGAGRLFFARGSPVHRLFHLLTRPLVAEALFIGTLGYWHLPAFYDAAQGRTLVHTLEHLQFFGVALLFWWPVIHPSGGRRRLGYGQAVFYLLPPLIEGPLIGAVLTFAPEPIYATYRRARPALGWSGLQDQQLGGLIMWVPSGFVYLGALLTCLTLFLREEERKARAGEQLRVAAP